MSSFVLAGKGFTKSASSRAGLEGIAFSQRVLLNKHG
jgi:hypothetical protein